MEIGERLSDDEWLWRRVFHNQIKPDGSVSPRAFSPRPKDNGFLSVDMERLTSYQKSVLDPTKFAVFRFQAAIPHSIPGINCTYDPLEGNDAHALIGKIEPSDETVAVLMSLNADKISPS